jgi:hypothetical protein
VGWAGKEEGPVGKRNGLEGGKKREKGKEEEEERLGQLGLLGRTQEDWAEQEREGRAGLGQKNKRREGEKGWFLELLNLCFFFKPHNNKQSQCKGMNTSNTWLILNLILFNLIKGKFI